jgi:hypothetical protein
MYEDKLSPAINVPERESEIAREVRQLHSSSQETRALTETLLKRLASVIAPLEAKGGPEKSSSPVTPHASNLREIADMIVQTNEQLSFILRGLAL